MATPIIALDVSTSKEALALVDRLADTADFYKVGLQLYTAVGPAIVRDLRKRGKRVFLDLKLHDIPNTVAHAVTAAAQHEVDLLTVHTSGGALMLSAAAEAVKGSATRLLGVTILTSLGADEIERAWGKTVRSVHDEVTRLAALAVETGLHGIVASPLETESVRRHHGAQLLIVTPGIRPAGSGANDQTRIATPADAARAGADYLVIGRPVTAAADPVAVMRSINEELAAVA